MVIESNNPHPMEPPEGNQLIVDSTALVSSPERHHNADNAEHEVSMPS